MRRILCLAPLLILLICGSACTTTEAPTPKITPVSTEMKTQLDATMKGKLAAARYELQLYEEELKATKEARSGKQDVRDGRIVVFGGPSASLLDWENKLKEKVIQAKVKVRELEILLNEKHAQP